MQLQLQFYPKSKTRIGRVLTCCTATWRQLFLLLHHEMPGHLPRFLIFRLDLQGKFLVDKTGSEIPNSRGKREGLAIKLSRDDGKTWPVIKELEAGPSAYSDLAVLPDGNVLCLYEGNKHILVARFTLEWLTE